jgi:hypothetical protein
VKAPGLTGELLDELSFLRQAGVRGTLGGAVICVDIKRNAGGEDGALGLFGGLDVLVASWNPSDAETRKRG